MKRLLPLLLCPALLLTGCHFRLPEAPVSGASDPSGPHAQPSQVNTLILGLLQGDALDPYQARSDANRAVCSLLYESLITADADDQPQLCLAATAQVTGERILVSLRADARFSDGSAVTPQDVEASLQAARQSDRYRETAGRIEGLETNGGTMIFTVTAGSPQPQLLLTFPIIRQTGGPVPLGSGPYRYSGGTLYPTRDVQLGSIPLRTYEDLSALRRARGGGELTFYYDTLSEGFVPQITGASEAVPLTSLAILCFNGQQGITAGAQVRQALSAALRREELTAAFGGYARPAHTLFPASWQTPEIVQEKKIKDVVAQWRQLGYNTEANPSGIGPLQLLVPRKTAF